MRLRRCLVLAVLALAVHSAQADDKADVKAIIDKAVTAHGGEQNLDKKQVVKQDGKPHITAELTEFKYEDKADAALFEKP